MLDDDDGVTQVCQAIEDQQQLLDVVEMEAGGGFIEDVQRTSRLATAQLARQLDALRLAPGKSRRRLAEMDVPQTHVQQRLELLLDGRDVFQHRQGVLHRHVENIGDGATLVLYCQGLGIVAAAAADLAGDENVGQEVHLNAPQPVSLTRFAAAAFHVEAEAAGTVATLARFGQHREEFSDGGEHARVSGRVRPRSAPDGRLVDDDHLIKMLGALQGAVQPGFLESAIELPGHRPVEDVVHQG